MQWILTFSLIYEISHISLLQALDKYQQSAWLVKKCAESGSQLLIHFEIKCMYKCFYWCQLKSGLSITCIYLITKVTRVKIELYCRVNIYMYKKWHPTNNNVGRWKMKIAVWAKWELYPLLFMRVNGVAGCYYRWWMTNGFQ